MKFVSYTGIMILLLLINVTGGNFGSIKGRVVDNENSPLPGASVIIENTTVGAVSNNEGEFIIEKAPIGTVKVVASMMGYKPSHAELEIGHHITVTHIFKLQEGVFNMGAVVVTGTQTPHVFEDMPVKTEIIPRKMIEMKKAVNLAEALSCQTGIWVENDCNNCNFTQIRINGLDGKYSQILIDGDPVMSTLAGVYGLEQIPEDMIDQIEIVKGGGSALYGGNAVAGVVNLITRRPMLNRIKFKTLNQLSGMEKPDNNFTAVAEMISKDGISGAFIYGVARHRSPYDHNSDGFSELGKTRANTLGVNWFYKIRHDGEISGQLHHIHEERRGGNKFNREVHEADIAEWLEHWRWGGKLKWSQRLNPYFDYNFYYSFALTTRKSYYGGLGEDTPEGRLEALNFYGRSNNPLHVWGAQGNYHFGNQLFTFGVEQITEKLEDKTASSHVYHIDETYRNFGAFVQDNFNLLDKIDVVAGIRVDKHTRINDPNFSPRLNLKVDLTDKMKLRAAFTTGFKPPQIFNEDMHIGAMEGDQKIIQNSDDLGPEKSISYSAGIDYEAKVFTRPYIIGISSYYTRLDDAFKEDFIKKEEGIKLWQRINGKGAEVMGVDLDLGIRPISSIELRTGLSLKKSEYDENHEDFPTRKFFRTPNLAGNFRLSYDMTHDLNISLLSNYLGKADVPHEVPDPDGGEDPLLILEKSDDFITLDIGFSYDFHFSDPKFIKFSFGIKNVFNSYQKDLDFGAARDPAYVYGPSQPRTLYLGFETSM